jgi:hypothetical protein
MMTAEEAITEFISDLDEDGEVRRLLDISVGRVLRAAAKRGEEFRPDNRKTLHVADWLRAAVVRNEAWLANVDELKRPRKLLKFSRFEDIVKEADKAMRAANARGGVSSKANGQTVYRDLDNGYRFVRLHTREALQRESAKMGHCVGNGGYDYVLEREGEAIISLRDKYDKPHATLHISGDRILQMRGKQNRQPRADYIETMMPVISQMRTADLCFGEFGFLVDTQGVRHQLTELPDGVEVDGSLAIYEGSVATLPENMTVHGTLWIHNNKMSALPRGLTVKGSLEINSHRKLRELPADLVVERRLSMCYSRIKTIPSGVKLGSLDACYSKLESIPEGFSIEGGLDISGTRVKSLPRGVFVGGDLQIINTKIASIPQDLSCAGITARSSAITTIPHNVVRGGPVDVANTKLHFLPFDLKVVGKLDISGTELSSLPLDMSQVEQLIVARSGVTVLPETLGAKQLKFLDISDTAIRKIPSDIMPTGELTARRCHLDAVPMKLERLDLQDTVAVLPDGLSVVTLMMANAKIKKLPDGLNVSGSLFANGSELCEIGENVHVGNGWIDIARTKVESIPPSFKIGGDTACCAGIDVSGTRLIALPELGDVEVSRASIGKTSIRDVPIGWTVQRLDAYGAPLSSVSGWAGKAYGVPRRHAAGLNSRGVKVVPWGVRHNLLGPYRLAREIAAELRLAFVRLTSTIRASDS